MASLSVHLAFIVASSALVFACSSAGGTASSTDATTGGSATGVTAEAFCASECIDADHDRCMTVATRFSDAFLAAFRACGDDPKCVQPRLDAAARTPAQDRFAADYCKACAGDVACVTTFWQHDKPGGSLAQLSDARLEEVGSTCLGKLASDAGSGDELQGALCQITFTQCALPLLQEDLKNTAICRKR